MRFFYLIIISVSLFGRNPVPATKYEQLTGKKLSRDSKKVWDKIYNQRQFVYGKSPAKFLSLNYKYIPYGASVLDIGMGEGRNAVFLAKKGYNVTGIDISKIAIRKSKILAKEYGVSLKTVQADLASYNFPKESFDSIICFYYVDREFITKMLRWLKPGGVLMFEAHTLKQRELLGDKADKESYYLKESELINLFSDYKILKFEEPVHEVEFTSSLIIEKTKRKSL